MIKHMENIYVIGSRGQREAATVNHKTQQLDVINIREKSIWVVLFLVERKEVAHLGNVCPRYQ